MKYSNFSAHDTDNLLEWGAAHAVRHGLRFSCVRGGSVSGIWPVSVCQFKIRTGKTRFWKPENRSLCPLALQNGEFLPAKISASCAAPELAKAHFILPGV